MRNRILNMTKPKPIPQHDPDAGLSAWRKKAVEYRFEKCYFSPTVY